MNKSESIKNLSVALCKAQGMLEHAKKGVENTFFKSKYADLASVIDAAKYPLSNNGLSVSQIVDTDENSNITLETILMHESGEWICGRYPIRPVKTDPQSMGSAITYARRYAFSAITGIAADDDDGNAASQVGVPNKEKPLIPTEKPGLPPYPDTKFKKNRDVWRVQIESGKQSAQSIIGKVSTVGVLTEAQKIEIENFEAVGEVR